MYKRHDDLQVRTNIYIKIDNGGTKTILGPARALRARAGKIIIITPNYPSEDKQYKDYDNNCIKQKQCFTEVAVHRKFYPLGIYSLDAH